MPLISKPEDNGNIVVINETDPSNIRLEIRPDSNNADFFQWFNFNLHGVVGKRYILNIENASKVRYPGWNAHDVSYQTYASYGNNEWFTVDTLYNEQTGKLTMALDLQKEQVQFAFFPPYSYKRHLVLIESAKAIPHCEVSSLGKTNGIDGRDITLLTFGTPAKHKKEIWMIARQHPGEPQAEWYAEGLIEHLAITPELLKRYTFRIVPNMNPDGTYLGNLRTNKEGNDLNRMWEDPKKETSPEVYYVLQKMLETGVDFFMDIHSDEEIPKPFLDEAHLSCFIKIQELEAQEKEFMDLYIEMNPDMQNELNYGAKNRNDPVNKTLAAMTVALGFDCPSFTLEMPTKQWSWQQCKSLAQDFFKVLDAFYAQLKQQEDAMKFGLQSPGTLSFLHSKPDVESSDKVDVAHSSPTI
jgi:murein tripeptide amidase MpaA